MGTNYYLKVYKGKKCDKCGRSDELEELHIGKSSAGWAFLFNPNNNLFNSFRDWREVLEKNPNSIFSEYGNNVSLFAFYKMIADKKDGKKHETDKIDFEGYRISKYSDFC